MSKKEPKVEKIITPEIAQELELLKQENGPPASYEANLKKCREGMKLGHNHTFAKGNKGGPGNPFIKQTRRFQTIIRKCTTNADMREIWAVLLKESKTGSFPHLKLVLSYLLGEPTRHLEATIENISPQEAQTKLDVLFNITQHETPQINVSLDDVTNNARVVEATVK